jgi:hypothetical protein
VAESDPRTLRSRSGREFADRQNAVSGPIRLRRSCWVTQTSSIRYLGADVYLRRPRFLRTWTTGRGSRLSLNGVRYEFFPPYGKVRPFGQYRRQPGIHQ